VNDLRILPVPDGLVGERADVALAKLLGLSRSACTELLNDGHVVSRGKVLGKSDRILADAMFEITMPKPKNQLEVVPVEVDDFRIVFEDDDIVVIDKGRVIAHGTSEELKDQIGGDRIEIAVVDPAVLGRAVEVIRSVSTGEPKIDELRVSAPVSGGSTVLVDAIRALDLEHIEVADLVLRRPTLDDVFLSLTGHAAEEETAAAAEPARGRSTRRR
jgi:hypothetical protein